MQTHNTIKIEDNKIIITTPEEHQIFETLKAPNYTNGSQFIDIDKIRYFLTKTKPNKGN
jgi:hypothetical protein